MATHDRDSSRWHQEQMNRDQERMSGERVRGRQDEAVSHRSRRERGRGAESSSDPMRSIESDEEDWDRSER